MPDRIIRESICTSETLNRLSDFEERFWHRLIVNCDDYGRFDARPAILKGRLFPLMDGKTQRNMQDALHKLASVGLVELYESEGKPFLRVVTWDKYQRIRAKRSKFPAPPEGAGRPSEEPSEEPSGEPDNICCPLTADVAVIQSESNAKCDMRNAEYEGGDQGPDPPPAPAQEPGPGFPPPAAELPLNDKSRFAVTAEQAAEWAALYPAVDVMQELRKMRGWLDANPSRRKTRAGILRFVTGWLAKEQDRGGTAPASRPRQKTPDASRPPSFDLAEYEQAVRDFVPVYTADEKKHREES